MTDKVNHHAVTTEEQETTALYALGALSQHEARAFAAHLQEGCEACHAELERFNHIVDALGIAPVPVAPPAHLRDLLATRIEKEESEAPPESESVVQFTQKLSRMPDSPAPARSAFSRVLPWAAAAALLIAAVYSFTSWRSERQSLRAELERERGRASDAAGENRRLKDELGEKSELSYELAQINSVLSSPQWRVIPLAGQETAPNSSARVYWDVQGNRWVLTADLPPAPEGKVYQLWFVTPTEKISAGLITTDKAGHGFAVVPFPPGAAQLAAAAITLEPQGGSQQPTMPIYALGKLS
jgi:anti-sigma-K factor RskA